MKIRRLGLTMAGAALALATFAGSASAVTPTAKLFVVHGIPGAVVDVCVGNTEVKSTFRYGQQFVLDGVAPGTYKVRVFAASARTCAGTFVFGRTVTLTGGMNATAVARVFGGAARLQIFANNTVIPTAGKATITVRHTATAPTVDVWLNGGAAPAIAGLAQGASVGPVELSPAVYAWWASGVGGYAPVIGPRVAKLAADTAYQIYAVGTNALNYRFVVVAQPGVSPA
jgi:hypothetical protein